jgi:NADH-quinone oxidoreductase subunit C
MSDVQTAVERIQAQFPDAAQEVVEFRGETTLIVDRDALVEICTFARDTEELEFDRLSDLSGMDYWPDEPRFAVNYQLYSLERSTDLRLKVYVPGDDPVLPTVTGVWPVANWWEREVIDMFGLTFTGHPDPRRILLPFDWTGHPLRKDYPLGYEEVQFSFNVKRIDDQKPYAKE